MTPPGPDKATVDAAINQFLNTIDEGASTDHRDLIKRMLRTVVKVDHDGLDRLDIKIIERALRELHKGFRTFAPWRHHRKIAVFGSARSVPGSLEYDAAVACARGLVEEGFGVVTGAGPGIMQAGNEGAGIDNSYGVNINLPFEQTANPFIRADRLVDFKYFFTRKVVFVKEVDGVILFPGGFGTQDEGFETLTLTQTGKAEPSPIVMVDPEGSSYWSEWDAYVRSALLGRKLISPDDLHLYKITDSVDEAVDHVVRFYANYHSMRYLQRNLLVFRLQHEPSEELIADLNRDFRDIIVEGDIEPCGMHERERDEAETARLHRLSFRFDQRQLGRLRQLIDVLNDSVTEIQKQTGATFPRVRGVIPGVYPGNEDADDNGNGE